MKETVTHGKLSCQERVPPKIPDSAIDDFLGAVSLVREGTGLKKLVLKNFNIRTQKGADLLSHIIFQRGDQLELLCLKGMFDGRKYFE